MAQQIIFFEKNLADYSIAAVDLTASQSDTLVHLVQNRNNRSAWITTGSVDADNTTIVVDFGEARTVSEILLLKHNFKAYTVKYWNGSSFVAFATPISETTNTADNTRYSRTPVSTQKLELRITGTMTANADKYLYQLIATNQIGQLAGWPVISDPVHNRNKMAKAMLSGKMNIAENVGGFSCVLSVPNWRDSTDLDLIEELYNSNDGFLVWLCGGDESQFSSAREGYRLEDVYLMKTANNYEPEFWKGAYYAGINLKVKLAEVVE